MCNRNATATWSGFAHQGQVGLLVALREMLNLDEAEYQNYYLEYEKTEDIAIYRNPPNKEYLSVHQVKAYYSGGHLKSKYDDVLNNDNFQSCGNDFLHTAVEIADWETSNTGNSNNIQRYEYSQGVFHCRTDQVNGYLLQELAHFAVGGVEPQILLDRLTFELDLKIRTEHTKGQKALFDIKFSFEDIKGILDKGNLIGDEIDIYHCRKHFYKVFKDYVSEHDIPQDHLDRVSKDIIDPIYRLPNEEFNRFVKQLNLAANPSSLKVGCGINFNESGFLNVFFDVLFGVTQRLPEINNESVQYQLPNNSDIHVLTTISEYDNPHQIVRNIIDNAIELNPFWESHQLINRHHDVKFIEFIGGLKFNSIKDETDFPMNNFSSFSNRGGLIQRDGAKQLLNDE
jgi:hypothetical protein